MSSRLIVSCDGITLPGGNRGASFDPVLMEMTGLVITVTDPSFATDLAFSGVPCFTSSQNLNPGRVLRVGPHGCHFADFDAAKQDVGSRLQPARIPQVGPVGNTCALELRAAYADRWSRAVSPRRSKRRRRPWLRFSCSRSRQSRQLPKVVLNGRAFRNGIGNPIEKLPDARIRCSPGTNPCSPRR